MITMTSRAHQVVRQVTSHPRVGRLSGLRISAQDAHPGTGTTTGTTTSTATGTDPLSVRTVAEPQKGDRVLESDGARVYLDDVAEPHLDGHVLDAVTEDDGRVHFMVKD